MIQTTITIKLLNLVKLNMHILCQPIFYLYTLAKLTGMFLLICYCKTSYIMSNVTQLDYDGEVAL